MTKEFNREYKEYKPTAATGPPTNRICKPVKCKEEQQTPPPSP